MTHYWESLLTKYCESAQPNRKWAAALDAYFADAIKRADGWMLQLISTSITYAAGEPEYQGRQRKLILSANWRPGPDGPGCGLSARWACLIAASPKVRCAALERLRRNRGRMQIVSGRGRRILEICQVSWNQIAPKRTNV